MTHARTEIPLRRLSAVAATLLAVVSATLTAQAALPPRPEPAPPRLRVFAVDALQTAMARRLGTAPEVTRLPGDLTALLRLYLPDPQALPEQALTLDRQSQALIAVLDPARATWLERFVGQQAAGSMRSVHVQASVFRVETTLADELGLGASARIHADHADAARVVEALQRHAGDAHVQLPAFDTLPLAAARTARTTPLAYVRDWREHERVEPGGAPLLDPLVEVIQEGATLDVRVALLDDGQLGVEVGLTWRRVQRPIPTGKRELAGRTLEVAEPKVDEVVADSAWRQPEASTVIVALPEDGRHTSVLVLRAEPAARGR